MSLVSIIIPCFNSEAFVADAIRSALNQTYQAIEIIVVDDGSTDGTVEVLSKFGRQIQWVTGPNRGACSARNRGLSMARGEFVQFLDSDDLLHPDKVKRSLEYMKGGGLALVYSLHEVVLLEQNGPPPLQWNRTKGYEDPIAFMFEGDLQTAAPLHRRDVIESVRGFREDLSCAQDREFHFRMALAGVKFSYIPEVLFTIRRRQGSIGTSNVEKIHEQRGYIALEVYNQLQSSERLTESYRVKCAGMLMKAARGLFKAKPEKAYQFMRHAYEVHPSGGVELVYSNRAQKLLKIMGPRLTEGIIWYARRLGIVS